MPSEPLEEKPYLWLVDSGLRPLAECEAFSDWANILRLEPDSAEPDWDNPPDAIFFSAEIEGGPGGERFAALARAAGDIPLLAVASWRSLSQALAFFRAGAGDYLSLPLSAEEARAHLADLMERNSRRVFRRVMLELADADPDAAGSGGLSANLEVVGPPAAPEDDILAGIDAQDSAEREKPAAGADGPGVDEPEIVDGLPIPALWEELPCGIIVFDSAGNLAFSNALGLELFGHASPADLQEALNHRPGSFAAYNASGKPLADNQWPHRLAGKARAARSAVVSLERPDGRRLWLRIDCLPHLAGGEISRLSMTVVNLTGELPNFSPPREKPAAAKEKTRRRTRRKR